MSSQMKLFPFQQEAVEKLKGIKAVLIGDDMLPRVLAKLTKLLL